MRGFSYLPDALLIADLNHLVLDLAQPHKVAHLQWITHPIMIFLQIGNCHV
jgi:hypothetical protein